MSQDICEIIEEPVLEEKYTTDVSRSTVNFFKSKGIKLCQLLKWQEEHPVIYPWDEYYNSLRLGFNRAGQFFPKMIIMAEKKKDIKWGLDIAIDLNIEFAIRSGAHDSMNYSLSNGIIIDISNRNYIEVCEKNIVKMGGGVRIGPLVDKLAEHGLIIPTGTCQNVAISGLCLGGGIGFLERKYGLTLDNVLSMTILLADGEFVEANCKCNADLFWALRGGGGGSLGIVTDFVFQAHCVKEIILFEMWIPFCHFETAIDTWQRWAPFQPNNLTTELDLYPVADKGAKESILITGQYEGRQRDLEELLCVFAGLPTHYNMWKSSIVEAAIYHATPHPPLFYSLLNLFGVEFLSEEAIFNLKKLMKCAPIGISIEIDALGGAVSEVGSSATAFAWRESIFWILIRGTSNIQSEMSKLSRWVRDIYDQLLDDGLRNPITCVGREYCNFKDPDLTQEEYPLAYWGENALELSEIKTKYDPDNIFSYEQSIPLL
jgi:hypothetical protein